MKVAIIGSGISGLSAACHLQDHVDVTVFEKDSRIGGHADTQTIEVDGKLIDVDTGFIVFNPDNYPTFMELIEKYQVDYQDSDMSFAVSNRINGLEYNASSLNQLFCQRSNLVKPSFYKMIGEIFRFYKEMKTLVATDNNIGLGDYLKQNRYSENFIQNHIIPMTCALWSGDVTKIMDFPARFLAAFMNNHKMLQAFDRPVWKTIAGGSKNYLAKISAKAQFRIRAGVQIKSVIRDSEGVSIQLQDSVERFDKVIFATHSDQALALMESPTKDENSVLGDIDYQDNTILLHRDPKVLPYKKSAWASWSVLVDEKSTELCRVSYYMNLLQSLDTEVPVIVSLNMEELIDSDKVWKKINYSHPIYNQKTIDAQKRRHLIQGKSHSYFCGAYWGWGFHEDGARSGKEAALQLLAEKANA